jgi:hypothetical protein
MVAIKYSNVHYEYLFSHDIQNSSHALYVSKFYKFVGEHNKKMSSKK